MKETLKKIFLPLIVMVIMIQAWSMTGKYISGFPTPSDTYIYAFGGTTSLGDELKGVLTDPFYVVNKDDKVFFGNYLNL